ncbi:MAG: hypothetical protein K1X89_14910 [Myxococcaceae bacterium]|nr:hypothetical protein [Myxococcaceae bacterium]
MTELAPVPPWRRPSTWAWLLGALFAVLLMLDVRERPRFEPDTWAVYGGAQATKACLASGQRPCPNVSYFPLFQYLVVWMAEALGASPEGAMRTLTALSVLSLLGLVVLGARWLAPRQGTGAAALFVLGTLASYGLWYARTTFNELPSALVALALAAVCVDGKRWWLVGPLALLTGLTKEVALPFVLWLGVWPLWRRTAGLKWAIALGVGALAGTIPGLLFNQFRFGTLGNTFLLDPILQAHGVALILRQSLAIWFSPSGGLLEVAPLAGLTVLGVAGWALARKDERSRGLWLLGLVGATTLGFARWFSPFGWWSWGPRLMLPWVPAMFLIALTHPGLPALLERRGVRLAAGVLALLAVSLNVFAIFGDGSYYGFFEHNRDVGPTPAIQADPDAYFRALEGLEWPKVHFWVVDLWRETLPTAGRRLWASGALAVLAVCWWWHAGLRKVEKA